MAAIIANKPAPPHQKLKRPSLPAVQTSTNGALSSHSSPSPLLSSKRPPDGSMQPPSAIGINGVSGGINGTGPRASNRRRDSQKPGDILGRASRASRSGQSEGQKSARREPEPYVKTDIDVLKKFRGKAPSFAIHLYPTNFRIEKSDSKSESFAYNSPFKVLLQHIKKRTVPHELMEFLLAGGVKFYDGCLIVQLHDHKSTKAATKSTPTDYDVASVHNISQHTTLTPYATDEDRRLHAEQQEAANKGTSDSTSQAENAAETARKEANKATKIWTTVLFPTPQSMNEDLVYFASLPDPRANTRKQSSIARTPSSATTPHPQTPMSAVPPTPTSANSAKRQRKWLRDEDFTTFESNLIHSQAPPLFLDPVENLEQAQKLIEGLTDDRHKNPLPPPKRRKRTAAEMADDEAAAAEEEIFMLAMDENNRSAMAKRAGGQAGINDGELGTSSFEPRFERWKAIEQIREDLRIRKLEVAEHERQVKQQQQRDREAAMQQAQRERHMQEQAARHAEAQKYAAAQQEAEDQKRRVMLQQKEEQKRQNEQRIAAAAAAVHPPISNAMSMSPHNQPIMPVSQANHSSPIVRNGTPHSHSSPAIGHSIPQSIPMNMTSSGQGMISSPARPSPASQHAHPMVRPGSQQGSSRVGTPQIQRSTPAMTHATPVMSNSGLPSGRIGHATPPNVTSNPHINGTHVPAGQAMPNGLNPAQRVMHQEVQRRQMIMNQYRQLVQTGQPIPPEMQRMIQNLQTERQQMEIQQRAQQQSNYQRQLAEQQQQLRMASAGSPHLNRSPHTGAQGMPNGNSMSPQQQAQLHQQQQQQQQQQLSHLQTKPPPNPVNAAHQQQHAAMLRGAANLYQQEVQKQQANLGRPLTQDENIQLRNMAMQKMRAQANAVRNHQAQQAQAQAAAAAQQGQQQQPHNPHLQQQQQQQQQQGAFGGTPHQQQQQRMMMIQNAQQQQLQQATNQQQQHIALARQQMMMQQQQQQQQQQGGGMGMRMG